MARRKIVQTLFLLLVISKVFGQPVTSSAVNLQEKISVSPNAASISKYLDFPVNMATGIPNISVPLYTIHSGNITIPITLSYHAGGIKVNEKAGWVGLGWSIDPGGSIIKKTNGLDDIYLTSGTANNTPFQDYLHPDYSSVPYNQGYTNMTDAVDGFIAHQWPELTLDSGLRFMGRIVVGQNDGEADEFFYNTSQGSGKFYYNQKLTKFQTNKMDGSIVTGDTSGWTITTSNSLSYLFAQKEHTLNPLYERSLSSQSTLITGWLMSFISDPVNDKVVAFDYDNYPTSSTYDGETDWNDYLLVGGLSLFAVNGEIIKRTGDNYVLKTIRTENETINFIKDTAARYDGVGPHSLKEIQIYDRDSTLLKKFLFTYYYVVADSGCTQQGRQALRLILNSLQEVDYDKNGTSHTIPPYYFKYDTTIKLPCTLAYAQDKWGFYNGKNSNTTMIPHNPYFEYYSSIVGANRNADSNSVKAGILNGVIYPTGGKAVFEFESNRGWADTILVGGLRVKKITYYDSLAQSSKTTEYHYSNYTYWNPIFWYQLQHLSGPDVFYLIFDPILRVESEPIAPNFISQGAPGYYSVVEKREKSTSGGDLLSKHYFTGFSEPIDFWENIIGVPHPKIAATTDILESGTENYKREDNGSYTLVQTESSGYSTLTRPSDYVWNVKGAWNWLASEWCEWAGGDPFIYAPGYMIFYVSPSIHAYKVYPSQVLKGFQSSENITNTGSLIQNTFYSYDTANANLTEIRTIDSKGDTTIKRIKYASQFIHTAATSGNNYQINQLLDYNTLSAPVEILTLLKKKDSTNLYLQDATLYEYDSLKTKKVYKVYDKLPLSSFNVAYNDSTDFYKDSHYVLYQEITAFDDRKNPKTVITLKNAESYIWDGQFIVAKTINASNEETAFSSFETSQKGNWTYSGSTTLHPTSPTGSKGYSLAGGNITKSGLNSSTTYIVSYWKRDTTSTVTVNSGSGTSMITKNGWVLYSHEISGTSSATISGTAYIDELRLCPKGSQMITFTYTPLVGITSQCDPSGHIGYYQYEGDKLKIIKDADGKILKRIDYKYQAGYQD